MQRHKHGSLTHSDADVIHFLPEGKYLRSNEELYYQFRQSHLPKHIETPKELNSTVFSFLLINNFSQSPKPSLYKYIMFMYFW